MKPLLPIILLLATTMAVNAQKDSLLCAGKKIAINPGNRDHTARFGYCYDKPIDSAAVPDRLWDAATRYLQGRTGKAYKQLRLRQTQSIVCERFKKEQIQQGLDTVNLYQRTKYALEYEWRVQGRIPYVVSLLFDYTGTLIIPDQLPQATKTNSYEKLLDVCKAIAIANKDPEYTGPAQAISLEYLQEEDVFVWQVEKPTAYDDEDHSSGSYRYIIINAHTGKFIKRKESRWHRAMAPPAPEGQK